MQHPGFFQRAGPFPLTLIAAKLGAELGTLATAASEIEDVKSLSDAKSNHLAFFDNKKYLPQLSTTQAGACLVEPAFVASVPTGTAVLKTKAPYTAFAQALRLFYSDALRPTSAALEGAHPTGYIDPSARIGERVTFGPGATVGPEAEIGSGTRIAAGAVIGYRVSIGQDCYVGPCASITHAIIGDRVIVHAGVRIGQDGFGFAMSGQGHLKIPQVGRVLIGNDVEIGANSAIDRGTLNDTTIGEGTKIDNLVQIGHNAVVGRHCVIVAQTGIAGSAQLGDFVVMGGHSGVVGHVKIGPGARIAGMAHVKDDVPAGARMGGTPAVPFTEWARSIAAIKRLAARR